MTNEKIGYGINWLYKGVKGYWDGDAVNLLDAVSQAKKFAHTKTDHLPDRQFNCFEILHVETATNEPSHFET